MNVGLISKSVKLKSASVIRGAVNELLLTIKIQKIVGMNVPFHNICIMILPKFQEFREILNSPSR